MKLHRSLRATLTTVGLAGVLAVSTAVPANAMPPNIPSAASARTMLSQLVVAPDGPMDGYSRDKFPHWHIVSGTCDTRETVLKRDGSNVQTGSDCYPASGTWNSPYDGASWTQASDIDIDHVVPLADAWRTGAAKWTTAQREAYANDLDSPQLIAVTDNVNQAKGDQTPDQWMPPLANFHCTYAEMWVGVKDKYKLTITSAEKSKLNSILSGC